ncbi:MAG: response regulator, partial [Azonexus sp.]|nr:response regulator [Azonexus sp.]
MNILLADNTPLYRDILQQALEGNSGFEISFVTNIAEAMRAIQEKKFQFFILAWQLDDGDGLELARKLRDTK